jgi:hypothetical protein
MKLKVISDGTIFGTRVINQDTGEELKGVVSIKWGVSCDEPNRLAWVALRLINTPVELTGDAIDVMPEAINSQP